MNFNSDKFFVTITQLSDEEQLNIFNGKFASGHSAVL